MFQIALSMIVLSLSYVSSQAVPDFSERGMFMFGGIYLDFRKETASYGPFSYQLINCSSAEYYCAKTRDISIAVPRSCSTPRTMETWKVGDVNMEVLDYMERPARIHGDPPQYYLLGSADVPYIIWKYLPREGVYGFYFDGRKKNNLYELTKSGGEEALISAAPDPSYQKLRTLDPFAKCVAT